MILFGFVFATSILLGQGSASVLSATGAVDVRHYQAVGNLPDEPITAAAVLPTDDDVLFAGTDGFLFRSDDGGETWRPVLSFARGISGDDTNDTRVGAADDASDYGAGASAAAPAVDVVDDIGVDAVDPADALTDPVAAAGDGVDDLPDGSAASVTDAVAAWPRVGPGVRTIAFGRGQPGMMYVATARGLFRSATRGDSFERVTLPGGSLDNDTRDVVSDPQRPGRLFVATAGGLRVSSDGGASFEAADGRAGVAPSLCLATAVVGSDVHILLGTERGLFRSTDAGASFLEMLLRGAPAQVDVGAVAIALDGQISYAGTATGLFAGERGSPILESYGGIPRSPVLAVSPDPRAPRAVMLGVFGRGVMLSKDAGLSVVDRLDNVPSTNVVGFARPSKDADALLVATDRGLFRSMPGSGVVIKPSGLAALRAKWATEPSLPEVVLAALRFASMDAEAFVGLRTRARWSKVLPQLRTLASVQYGTQTTAQYIVRAADNLPPGVDPTTDNTDIYGNATFSVVTPSQGLDVFAYATLTWDLDQIVLNANELTLAGDNTAYVDGQRRIINRVRELFVSRRRAMAELASTQRSADRKGTRKRVGDALKIDELTAELDAATGGMFAAQMSDVGVFADSADSISLGRGDLRKKPQGAH